jgi:hypothetical protein
MSGLVAAAKKEGTLNVITLPADWANYGTIMKDFTAKYGIKINDANPDGSSQDEINAMQSLKGQSREPASRSRWTTSCPSRLASSACIRPSTPPPTTTTVISAILPRWSGRHRPPPVR